jgi:flagellin-like hook-associated protein FlgL
LARLPAFGNGIELVDDNPTTGETLTVSRVSGSNAAWELGFVAWGANSSQPGNPPAQAAEAVLAFAPPNDVNTALHVVAAQAGTGWDGIDIELRSTLVGDVATATFYPVGRRLIIDMADGQTTANTVLNAIVAEGTFTAQLDTTSDPTNNGLGTIVAPAGVAATTSGGTSETLVAEDTNPIETEGVFNTLIRLRDAVEAYDIEEMQRIIEMLDVDYDRLSFGRAEVGVRGQGLDAIGIRNQDDQVELRSALSSDIDIDFAQAATEFAARQASYEASLRTISNMFRLSLLDFL